MSATDRCPARWAWWPAATGSRWQAVGSADVDGTAPMARDSIFRIASITKPITAAAVMLLVEDGRIALDDPVGRWLPELASPVVVRTPAGPVDDVVPAVRPITVLDLLTFRAGYGFPSDFSLPAVGLLFSELKQGPPQPQLVAAPDEWMAALSRIPLLHQPGEAWLYNTCSDLQGVLVARVSGRRCRSSWPSGCSSRWAWSTPASWCRPASSTGSPATTGPTGGRPRAGRRARRPVEQPAGVPVGRRRAGLDRRRLACLRPDAARRRDAPAAAGCCRPRRCGR